MSASDVTKEESYHVPNDMRCYRENDRWMMPVESRHTDKNEEDVILNPRLASRDIADDIAIQLGGSFHVTTLAKLPSIVKHGLLPGGDKGTRAS